MINTDLKDIFLQSIFEYCGDVITIKDLNLQYKFCNKTFLKLVKVKDEEDVIGKTMYDLFPRSSLIEDMEAKLKEVITNGGTRSFTFSFNQSTVFQTVKQTIIPLINDVGKFEGILTISSDLSLTNRLAEKVSQMNALLENLPMLVYMKDSNSKYLLGSKYSKEFVERGYDKYIDSACLNYQEIVDLTAVEDSYVLQHKKPLVKERVAIDTNGVQHWYKLHKAPILNEDNSVNGLVTIAKNIDSEKYEENRKNLFLATLSHDLKNPLQAQISSLELFYKGAFGDLTKHQKEMLEMIIESSKYMRDMLYSLLKTCKENSGIIRLNFSKTNVITLLQKCIKEMLDFASDKGLTIEFNKVTISDGFVYIDEAQMRRVFGNLLNNAINYAYQNTTIKINIEEMSEQICITFENRSDEISKDLKEHIFDKYVCGKELQNPLGIGLGLYFCKKVINAHEGTITLVTKGTVNKFRIQIPKLDEASVVISEIVL